MMWRTLPWLPDYAVSESGDVRRVVAARTRPAGHVLTPTVSKTYARVKLATPDGERCVSVHRLVCEAFHGPAPEGREQVAHCDGDPLHNHYSNLRWATPKENHADRIAHGTAPTGENNPRARLTWDQVRAIRTVYDGSWGHVCQLAAEYGVSKGAMAGVCSGRKWKENARDAIEAQLAKLVIAAA